MGTRQVLNLWIAAWVLVGVLSQVSAKTSNDWFVKLLLPDAHETVEQAVGNQPHHQSEVPDDEITLRQSDFLRRKNVAAGTFIKESKRVKTEQKPVSFEQESVINDIPERRDNNHVGCSLWKQTVFFYEVDDTVRFEGINYNDGGDCNLLTGHFTCPVTGLYYITVSVRKFGNSPVYLAATRGPLLDNTFLVFEHDSANLPNITLTNSAIMSCTQGEFFQLKGTASGAVYGDVSIAFTSFTVVFLTAEADRPLLGFSATSSQTQAYSNGQTLMFEQERYNEGGYYFPDVGRFYCPVSGWYFISVNLKQNGTGSVRACVKETTIATLKLNYEELSLSGNVISNSGLMACEQGQYIQVQATGSGQKDGSTLQSHFTAFLVAEGDVNCVNGNSTFAGVTLYKGITNVYQPLDNITFDTILVDTGDYWDRALQRFVCETSGVYFLSINLVKVSGQRLMVDVKVETHTIFQLHETIESNPNGAISNNALFKCMAGWRVKVVGSGVGSVNGDHFAPQTTLTVFFISEVE